jgi:hypothetical protein
LATGRRRHRLGTAMLPGLRKDKHAHPNHQRYHDNGSETGQPSFSSCTNTWLPGCWLSTYCIVILRLHKAYSCPLTIPINRWFIIKTKMRIEKFPLPYFPGHFQINIDIAHWQD